ncbi:MAG TPA: DUF1634 domain-containing protein [Candidatus Acidoferrales bacterium]|nr:DUF1634 domain-containing protein [Candidatus Acidoferrales bacterium]
MSVSTEQRERRFELLLGQLLRLGVMLSAVVVFAGGLLYVMKFGAQIPQYGIFRGEPTDIRYASDILRDALAGHALGIIQLGLVLLIATPVARVAFSVVEFAAERDWLYVATTLLVLAVLIYSLASS